MPGWSSGAPPVALGADVPGAAYVLPYAGDDRDDVRLLSEALVCELIGQRAWELKVAVG